MSAWRAKKPAGDVPDIALFLLLSLFLPFLTIGRFTLVEGNGSFFLSLSNDLSKSLNVALAIPLLLFFFLAFGLLFLRRSVAVPKKAAIAVLLLFTLYVFSRCASAFLYPYKDPTFVFVSETYGQSAVVSYLFPLAERFVQFFTDVAFGLYFVAIVLVLPTFGKKWSSMVDLLLLFVLLVGICSFVYAIIVQRADFIYNIKVLFHIVQDIPHGVTSFTTNRNVFGFLLTLAFLSAMLLFVKYPNPISVLLMFLFTFTNFVIVSRTSIVICALGLLAFFLLYGIFGMRFHKVYAIVFLSFLLLAALLFLVGFFGLEEGNAFHDMLRAFWDKITDFKTIGMRSQHWRTALEMMTAPVVDAFGYGRIPFFNLYQAYEFAIGAEFNVVTSHNGLIEVFVHGGYVSLALSILFLLYLYSFVLRLFAQRRYDEAFVDLLVQALFLLHFFSEPRFFTLDESSTILLLLVGVFPLLSHVEQGLPANALARRRRTILTDGLFKKGA